MGEKIEKIKIEKLKFTAFDMSKLLNILKCTTWVDHVLPSSKRGRMLS